MVLASAQLQSEVISWTHWPSQQFPAVTEFPRGWRWGCWSNSLWTHLVICELIVILIYNFGSLLFFLLPKEDRWSPKEPSAGVKIRKYLLHEGPLSYIMSYTNWRWSRWIINFFLFCKNIPLVGGCSPDWDDSGVEMREFPFNGNPWRPWLPGFCQEWGSSRPFPACVIISRWWSSPLLWDFYHFFTLCKAHRGKSCPSFITLLCSVIID